MKTILDRIKDKEIVFNKQNAESVFVLAQDEWNSEMGEGKDLHDIIGITFDEYRDILSDGFYDVIARNLRQKLVASKSEE
jgi:hypothetical protein